MNRLIFTILLYPLLCQADPSCTVDDDGVCVNDDTFQQSTYCQVNLHSSHGDIYSSGGSAQAYKPNQPEKKEICDVSFYETRRHLMATWPFSKSSGRPPKITLSIKPWSCDTTDKDKNCCQVLNSKDKLMVEIWQTRPDGTYSSLRPGHQEGDCRARQQLSSTTVTFTTVAPGSTGSLGGLGPYGFDYAPYGPPTIHIMTSHPEMEPLLINVPIVMKRNTLEEISFKGSDWRGAGWTQHKPDVLPYNISSWKTNVAENTIEIGIDVFLQVGGKTKSVTSISDKLCRSWVYGLPYSFFVEPISLCAPSMMDFFAL